MTNLLISFSAADGASDSSVAVPPAGIGEGNQFLI
jgi:hypothetical protein